MASSKPYTFAFLADNFHSEYSNSIYSGLKSAASELGVSLMTVGGGDLNNPQFNDTRRNRIFDLINTDDFDGIIYQSGSLHNYITEEQFLTFCSRFDAIPSVHIGFNKTEYSSIIVDNKAGMRELVDHFIEEHHRKNIAFIRGPVKSSDADERFCAYRESLQAHGITFREDLVFTGTFLPKSGIAAVNDLLDVRKVTFDALIGANDQMALSAMNELLRRGKRIPADVIIGGFDNLISARACSPALTSVGQPVLEFGKCALQLLIDIIEGKTAQGTTITLPSRLVMRRSCGCISVSFKTSDIKNTGIPEKTLFEKHFVNLVTTDQSSVVNCFENQIISLLKDGYKPDELLSSVENVLNAHAQEFTPELYNKVWQMLLTISEEHFEIMQLMRQEENDQLHNFIDDMRKLSEPDSLRKFLNAKLIDVGIKEFMIARYKDTFNSVLFYRNSSDECGTVFRSNKFLPEGLSSLQTPFNLLCLPLYETDSDIGFFLTNPTDNTPVFLETIRSSLCGAIQMIDMIAKEREHGNLLEKKVQERTSELQRALNELSLANAKLEQISIRDELTGLLNRRGFLSTASRYISLSKRNMSNFICIFFDLDKLKQINDTYGHAHGDIAIKAIATILNKAFRKTDVIGRMGGDEFTVMALDCPEQNYEQIIKRMDLLVDEYNKTHNNPWMLSYSAGMASYSHEDDFDIDTLLKRADQALYKVKEEKRKNSG